jgi:hypothetical protein
MNEIVINQEIAKIVGAIYSEEDRSITWDIDGQAIVTGLFTEDLNAMHLAESVAVVRNESSITYAEELNRIACLWHAKADKRSIAFLRTFDKEV